jgi:hypothetical protein
MQTRTPAPLDPPSAHSRLTPAGQLEASEIASTRSFLRL